MKKYIFILLTVLLTSSVYAQKDVTKFLGIPVDGYKSAMIQKLKGKGYTYVPSGDYLKGEFNGTNVKIYIATNNNKVYRIALSDEVGRDEANIKIRFNNLVRQFENNKRYTSFEKQTLSDDVDISYDMAVNKIHEAVFYQNLDFEKIDTVEIRKQFYEEIASKYTKEQLENPTEDMAKELALATVGYYAELLSKKPVWFRIERDFGKYYIYMFYDNEWNRANGDDL